MTNYSDAIAHSISRNEIVTLDDHDGLREALLIECDDYAESDGVAEYWGEQDSSEWRVHIRTQS